MKTSEFKTDTRALAFREMINSFQRSRIILTAFELDLFTLLDTPHSASEVAQKLGTHPKATERLMNALTALELLHKKDQVFINSETSRMFLSSNSSEYMAGLLHSIHLWDIWSPLTQIIKTGKPEGIKEIGARSDKWQEAFIAAMHDRGAKQAAYLASLVSLGNARSLLDVGGGSGAFSIGFALANPQLKATIFDLPEITRFTRKYIEKAELENRIDIVSGNFLTDSIEGSFDVIFLSAVVHIFSYDENKELINKLAANLNPSGKIIIQDFIMNDDKINPPQGALFSINMLAGTESGDTYTKQEITEWLVNARLTDIKYIDTRQGTSLLTGEKPFN